MPWDFGREGRESVADSGQEGVSATLVLPGSPFLAFSAAFISVFQFSVHRFFPSLIRFIPKYLILFDAIVNGIVFLISLSDSSLSVYRNSN